MKVPLIAFILLAAVTPNALALKRASPEEISAIQEQIYRENQMDAKVKKADIDVYTAKLAKKMRCGAYQA